MEVLIQNLVSRVGVDRATAEKIVAFLKENAASLPKWLGSGAGDMAKGLTDKLPGGLGGAVGGLFDGDKK